ncbi:hypothetical protein RI129_012224 [Pyrocoelia pectoralis]|uniref:Uncharacterized protein n=1 Tax=Pyrocoelia pectoralis TaxID=417401 RepID=A0AAN7UZU3_9COLE
MSNLFTVEIFNPEVTSWERWVKRLETAFKVFNTQEEVKLHYLLHYMGTTTYNVLCDKLAPEDPEKKTVQRNGTTS